MWSKLDTYLYPLQPSAECPSGTFKVHVPSGKMEWSEGMYGIHGLKQGEVVPTFELFMAHKHPLDREAVLALWADLSKEAARGPCCTGSLTSAARNGAFFPPSRPLLSRPGRGTTSAASWWT